VVLSRLFASPRPLLIRTEHFSLPYYLLGL
jgi:hypothetical protein